MQAYAKPEIETPEEFLRSIEIDPARWSQEHIPAAEVLLERLIGLESLGFTPDEALLASRRFPFLLGLTTEKVAASMSHFETYGFTRKQIMKIIVRWGSVVAYAPARIDEIWMSLEAYGFTREQVRKLIGHVPAILCYTTERTNRLLANLEAGGYARERVIGMVVGAPAILCMTSERTNDVIAAVRSVGLDASNQPSVLIRAPYVIRGRIALLRSKDVEVTLRHLRLSHEDFEKRWGCDRAAVIALDPLASETETAP